MANASYVEFFSDGSEVGNIDNDLFVVDSPTAFDPVYWLAKAGDNGTIQFSDQFTRMLLTVGSTEVGALAGLGSPTAPVTSWRVSRFTDSNERAPVHDPAELQTGHYALQDPDTGRYLSRTRERSDMGFYQIALQPDGADPAPFTFKRR